MANTVQIVVNGFSGPRSTLDASREWTIRQVKEAIHDKIDTPVDWLKLLKDTKRLFDEATVGSLISEDCVETLELTLIVEPPRPVDFVGMKNGLEQVEPGHLLQVEGAEYDWSGTAVSSDALVIGQGRGLRFRPGAGDNAFFIGLGSHKAAPLDCDDIAYAAFCGPAGQFGVFESGDVKLNVACSDLGAVELRVHGDRIEFYAAGELQYTSELQGEAELHAMAAFGDIGAEALEIQWL